MADIVPPSTALGFVNEVSEEHQSTSPSAIQVKNQQKTINIEEKLDVISRHEKDEWFVAYAIMLFTHSSTSIICDIPDRNTKSAKPGTKVFV